MLRYMQARYETDHAGLLNHEDDVDDFKHHHATAAGDLHHHYCGQLQHEDGVHRLRQ